MLLRPSHEELISEQLNLHRELKLKILHSADWHLGRVFHNVALLEDQAHMLQQFIECVGDRKPDAVIIAGDIYDRSIPPSDAVSLLDDTLTKIVIGLKVPVIIIAGNHDSAERLSFGSRLLQSVGLTVRGPLSSDCDPVLFEDGHGTVAIYPVPYSEPPLVRAALNDNELKDHHQCLNAQLTRIRNNHNANFRSVVVAHAFVQGGKVSESERPLSVVGGSGAVGLDVFDGFNYVALGHLHRHQSMDGQRVNYSGSLMKYSFAEASHEKSLSLVNIDGFGNVEIEPITLKPKRDLRIITGSLEDIIAGAVNDLQTEDFILARLTNQGAILDAMGKLRTAYPNALAIERIQQTSGGGVSDARDHRKISTDALFSSFYKEMTGTDLSSEVQQILHKEIAHIEMTNRESA